MRFRRMTEREMVEKTPGKLQKLKELAEECANNEEIKRWLWLHTLSEEEFHDIRRCMLKIATFKPGIWEERK